jgi:type I restriction enzyme S subunit
MEVMAGYKQTDVGIIPEEWRLDCIRNLASITTGAKNTQDRIDDGEYPFFVRSSCVERINSYSFDGEAVLTAGDGVGTGKIYHYIKGKFDFHQRVYKISDFNKNLDGYFFFLYFSTHFYDRIMTMTAKSSVDSVRMEMIADMVVLIPPLPEQRAIATTLSDVDALITSLDELIAKKRDIKQAAMQELLTGKRRLPGFDVGRGYKQTEVGIIPEDWEVKRLGDLFEITSSKRVFQSEWTTQGIPFYRARELAVLGESGFVCNELFITNEMYDAFKRSYGVPSIGDMLVTGVGTLGKAYVVTGDHEFYFKDGNIIWFKIAGKVTPEFLRQLYLTPLIEKQISDGSAGTTVGTYTISGAKKTVIPLPPLPEQRAIATVLSDMDAELAALEQKRDKTKAIKQGMMQELLRGRIRLV